MQYSRRSMQRLGYLKSVVALALPGENQTLEGITKRFEKAIRSTVDLPDTRRDHFGDYVTRFRLNARYPRKQPLSQVELQDAYLCNPTLPSASGAITGEMGRVGYRKAVYIEIPTWAVLMKLVRARNYSLTDRGKLLRILDQSQSWFDFQPKQNPFLLLPDQAQRFFFFYCLLDADGDLLRELYRSLLDRKKKSFDRAEAGLAIADVLEGFLKTSLSRPSTGVVAKQAQKAKRVVDSIRSQRTVGYGPRESAATPRVEPLVDCGLLAKTQPTTYTYRATDLGLRVLSGLAEAESTEAFIQDRLVETFTSSAQGTRDAVVEDVRDIYKSLKSGIGYVSIRELVVGSIALALRSEEAVPSIQQLEAALLAAPSRFGSRVRLARGRVGGLAQVRIHPSVFESSL